MTSHHSIRLRGPWAWEAVERFGPPADDQRGATEDLPHGSTRPPGDWTPLVGAAFVGRVRYRRHFHAPMNLAAGERVWLVFDAVDHAARAALNGLELGAFDGPSCPARFDVTARLAARNALVVEVTLDAAAFHDPAARGDRAGGPGGLIGDVRLEIGPA